MSAEANTGIEKDNISFLSFLEHSQVKTLEVKYTISCISLKFNYQYFKMVMQRGYSTSYMNLIKQKQIQVTQQAQT